MALRDQSTAGKSVKLGTLLLRAGIIAPDAFSGALEQAKQADTLVGNVLVRSGQINQHVLSSALHLQSLMAEGILTIDLAARALRLCHEQGATAQAALSRLGWKAVPQQKADEIGDLLVQSGFVTTNLYQDVMHTTNTAFSLVLKGALRCNQFDEVLKAASLVRADICDLEQATAALCQFRTNNTSVETVLRKEFGLSVRTTSLRLGELLVKASILREAEVLVALECALRSGKRLGQCLQFGTQLSTSMLDVCLEIQALAATGVLNAQTAAAVAKECVQENLSLGDYLRRTKLLSEKGGSAAALVKVLQGAELIGPTDAAEAMALTSELFLGPIAALAVTKRIEPNMYAALWHFDELMRQRILRPDQAIMVVLWCQRTGGDGQDAVAHLSGTFPPAAQEINKHNDALSHLQVLSAESLAIRQMMQKEKTTSYQQFFVIGVVISVAGLVACALFSADFWALFGALAFFAALGGYLGWLHLSRRHQQEGENEKTALAATCAVRRKSETRLNQASIAS